MTLSDLTAESDCAVIMSQRAVNDSAESHQSFEGVRKFSLSVYPRQRSVSSSLTKFPGKICFIIPFLKDLKKKNLATSAVEVRTERKALQFTYKVREDMEESVRQTCRLLHPDTMQPLGLGSQHGVYVCE